VSKIQTPPPLPDLLLVDDEDGNVVVGTGVTRSRQCGPVVADRGRQQPVPAVVLAVMSPTELVKKDCDVHADASASQRDLIDAGESRAATRRARWQRRRRQQTVVV